MSTTDNILRKVEIQKKINSIPIITTDISKDFVLPNHSGEILTTDHKTDGDKPQVVNVCYGTDATPPTASTVPIGTIYIQYTP